MQSNNIFTDLREKFAILSQKSSSRAPVTMVERAIEHETGERNAASAWLLLAAGSFLLTGVVVFMSFFYYEQIFLEAFPGWEVLLSASTVIFVEGTKIWLAYSALSAIIFGWMFKRWTSFFYWITITCIAAGTYYWSYTVSTQGLQIFVSNNGAEKVAGTPLSSYISQATAEIDNQIDQINQSNLQASTMKTKKGNISWSGQEIQMKNSATISALQQQRGKLIEEATKEYHSNRGFQEQKTSQFAMFLRNYGGKAEIALLFMLIAMIFFDRSRGEDAVQDETVKKVASKLQANKGVQLTEAELIDEFEKAKSMNGTYSAAPLGGGKP